MKKIILLTILFITSGCAKEMNINKFTNSKPQFILEDYFDGKVEAWGLFHDRFGNLKRQFKVSIIGTRQGDQIILDENFLYDDGEKDQRIWTIDILGQNKYRGKADDVVGVAKGVSNGNALNWTYELLLKVKDKTVQVTFDDWMFLQEKGVLLNRAEVNKFGINLGVVSITFLKIK
jgi:hypothetical protein